MAALQQEMAKGKYVVAVYKVVVFNNYWIVYVLKTDLMVVSSQEREKRRSKEMGYRVAAGAR